MSSQMVAAAIGAVGLLVTTLLTIFYVPTWKARVDRRRDREARSEFLLGRYSEPLARAAFDLQSRLYNIELLDFLPAYYTKGSYATVSTLWLLSQYLAWAEILRREVQLLDMGDVRRTTRLQLHLLDITDVLATDSIEDEAFGIYRVNQRAIGELMLVERRVGDSVRSDSMGYAEFEDRLEDTAFARWFKELRDDIGTLARDLSGHTRPIHLQRALIDLIEFLDPDGIRFPDPNERGKIPLPAGVEALERGRRFRPPSQVARFRYPADPWPVFDSWARAHRLEVTHVESHLSTTLGRGRWPRSEWRLEMISDERGRWYEINLRLDRTGASALARKSLTWRWMDRLVFARKPSPAIRQLVNQLLVQYDRPAIHRGWVYPSAGELTAFESRRQGAMSPSVSDLARGY